MESESRTTVWSEVDRAAVCLFNARGDYALALPAIRALSAVFGDRLTVICRPGMPSTFFPEIASRLCEPWTDFVDRRHVFDLDHIVSRVGPVDLFMSLNPWHHEYLDELLERLRPGISVGFNPVFGVAVDLDPGVHNLEQNFAIPRLVDPALRMADYSAPPVCDAFLRRAAAKMHSAVPREWRVLVFHGETKLSKSWPAERFSAALDRFLECADDVVVLDLGVGPAVLDLERHSNRVAQFRNLTLPFAMALLGEADMFLGVDSCLLHVADLYRVPGVGLFGPGSPTEFGFRFSPHLHVRGAGVMSTISVDEVVDSLISMDGMTRLQEDRHGAGARTR